MTAVLLPGLSGSSAADFAFLSPMLARRTTVAAIDLSCEPRFDSIVDRVRSELPVGELTLVGYSIGAAVALALAATTPSVARLVLVSCPLVGGERQRRFAATWAALPPSERRDLERFAALGDDDSAAGDLAPFDERLVALLPGIDLADAATAVTAETLVIGGANDALLGAGHAAAVLGAIEPSRLAIIDGGHALLHERPAHVLSLVDAFDRHPGRYPAGSLLPAESA
jgi:pimeloyl-ACP methyl ester carboxylesterase